MELLETKENHRKSRKYDKLTLREEVMVPKGTPFMGKGITTDRDFYLEKGDILFKYKTGYVSVVQRARKWRVPDHIDRDQELLSERMPDKKMINDIRHKGFSRTVWQAAINAKHDIEYNLEDKNYQNIDLSEE